MVVSGSRSCSSLPLPRRTRHPSKLSASGSTARPAQSWRWTLQASRCARHCSGWINALSRRRTRSVDSDDPVLRFVSGRVSPEWMLPKALWLKRNEPDVYARAYRVVECTDWMMFRLTGLWTLSLNHVAVKWNYARPTGGWPVKLLETVGLSDLPGKWPEQIVPLGRGEARLSKRAADELGLRAGSSGWTGGNRCVSGNARHGCDA